ncbi:hypothetical protein BDZ97DRAFT_1762195 [Flammula alnicola]|nr:hypothetical protein BDZ97DRAFT_1762195 [Flammula alnicola]
MSTGAHKFHGLGCHPRVEQRNAARVTPHHSCYARVTLLISPFNHHSLLYSTLSTLVPAPKRPCMALIATHATPLIWGMWAGFRLSTKVVDDAGYFSTSLVCKNEPEVDCHPPPPPSFNRLTPPPPLHLSRMQKRDGGGFFDAATGSSASLMCKNETEVDWCRLSMPPPPLHLPRIQERAGRGSNSTPPPPSHASARRRWFVTIFYAATASSTSLVCKNETEVDWCRLSMPPPLLHLPHVQERAGVGSLIDHHLPRMQERDGGGVLATFDAATTSPPPSHA